MGILACRGPSILPPLSHSIRIFIQHNISYHDSTRPVVTPSKAITIPHRFSFRRSSHLCTRNRYSFWRSMHASKDPRPAFTFASQARHAPINPSVLVATRHAFLQRMSFSVRSKAEGEVLKCSDLDGSAERVGKRMWMEWCFYLKVCHAYSCRLLVLIPFPSQLLSFPMHRCIYQTLRPKTLWYSGWVSFLNATRIEIVPNFSCNIVSLDRLCEGL